MMRQRSTGTAQIETRTTTRHGMIGADAATTDQNQSVTKCVFYHFLMCRWSLPLSSCVSTTSPNNFSRLTSFPGTAVTYLYVARGPGCASVMSASDV